MKDRAKSILLSENPFEKVKGHTKIELTDIKSGKKQIIEHDNDFQAGVLAKYMRSMGAYNNNPYANSTWAGQSIWRNLCGGILLFRDSINNNNDEVEYMPAGNQMVANGAYGVTNSGMPTELGSYNSVESQTSGNDSVTFVYDFTSSQGTGTISCVCLTTEIGGYIGYGNPSGVAHSTQKAFNANQSSNTLSGEIVYNNYRWNFAVDNTALTLTVTKTPTEVTKGSIFDNIAETADVYNLTRVITGSSFRFKDLGNGKAAIYGFNTSDSNYYCVTWDAGTTLNYVEFDMATETVTEKSVTNTTGINLKMSADRLGSCAYDMTDGYIIAPAFIQGVSSSYFGNEPRYCISLSDGTYFILDTGTDSLSRSDSYWQGKCADNLVFLKTINGFYMGDLVSRTAYPLNTNSAIDGYTMTADGVLYNKAQIYKNPLILSTVNNLATPVTKTAAQTMKVTYTLTKAQN